MKREMKAFAVASAMAVTVTLAGGAQAGAAEASPAARGDCNQSRYLCLWDAKNYKQNISWYQVTAAPEYKCSRGGWKPPYMDRPQKRLPRSTWNRTTKTWYGKDSRGNDKQIIRKTGLRGSTDPDISAWKSIKKWCWK
ncbi:hypothetical protein [Streptomyces ipomoeae]|uniref:hypothetical protein n=1 Tax=Streptomyces ipomoeae TaxID=103232 RepID=UPI001146492C|nr:hypothetical protein [Streptomyces ipomoeae]MDX2935806.1 hypothetical protein [Streptomyces ipomoeae]TQE21790.1 hypothetical protein SipoB123_25535 [Streptomyces ipomoeae]